MVAVAHLKKASKMTLSNGTYWMADFSSLYKFLFQLSSISDPYKIDVERHIAIKYIYAKRKENLICYQKKDIATLQRSVESTDSCIGKTMLQFEN